MKQPLRKVIDILNIFSSIFMILILTLVLIYSLGYFTKIYSVLNDLKQEMFYTALVICIVTIFSEWIVGRGLSILRTMKNWKEVENGTGRKKPISK